MELRINHLHKLFIILRLCFVAVTDAVTFNFHCDFVGQYSGLLQLGKYFPLDITLGQPYNASIAIVSACCDDVIIERASCSGCTGTGNNPCYTNSDSVSLDYTISASADCKESTNITVNCLSIKCESKDGSDTGFADPGDMTACMHDGKRYTCSGNGTWDTQDCKNSTWLSYASTVPDITSGSGNESSEHQLHTHTEYIWGATESLDVSNSTTNETVNAMLERKKAMKELFTFLIAFGIILLFVTALVCVFVIRKKRKEPFDGDYPLDYWHDRAYVDGVMNKAYYPKSPFSVNPIYASDKSASNDKSHPNIEKRSQKSRKMERKVSQRYLNQTEIPRKVKHDYSNKYVTTATGSNFYSYRKSPDADVTDIDYALGGCSDYGERSPSIPRGTKIYPASSFKPQRSGKKSRKQDVPYNGESNDGSDNVDGRERTDPAIYAVSYKNKLRNRLNDWSAEESDV